MDEVALALLVSSQNGNTLKKVGEFLRYNFTEDEVKEKSKNLALAVQTKTQEQEQQKAAQAQFKDRIDGADAKIGQLSRDINMGWEMRMIDCEILFHTPVQATKRIVRLDSGEIVRDVAMLVSELQENLFPTEAEIKAEDSEENIRLHFSKEE